MAISTYKIFLMQKNEETWKKLIDIKEFPDLGGAPEMLETTTLSDNMQTYIPGMTDLEYTKAVDDGSYTNFVRDSAGYGLAQWAYWSRKQELLEYAQKVGTSIADLGMQLEFMWLSLIHI